MNRNVLVATAVLGLGVLVPATATASSPSRETVTDFRVMAPVTEPFTGAANPINEVPGGGLPWQIEDANGELDGAGRIEVKVEGLVLARHAPVPPDRQGVNPIPAFKAIVSCRTVTDGAAATANVSTATAPATPTGNARIEDRIALPTPCFAPVIFVTSPEGSWFATTGR
ncbi:MAG: hypothetical protein GEV11_21075 [Streptosporangiales bacterium]|nr:hypothetical protein [Streptosporangiales bacterium]